MYLTFLLTLSTCCLSQIFSVPVPIDSTCSQCTWTEWFNVDHPQEGPNGGDWETLQKIKAQGFDVCRAPRNIHCRSVKFPYVPFKELKYNTTCERNTGLICLNKDNEVPCIDYEVQFLCCPCDDVAHMTMQIPTGITTSCSIAECTWTEWFNTHQPTAGPHGGDFENVTEIINRGYSICTAPQEAECRLVRFPYVPLDQQYSIQECSASHGLVCLNENQKNGECPDYEVRFLCCNCNDNYAVTPSTNRLVIMAKLDKTDDGSGMTSN